jgi:hypothetical protein
MMKYQLVVQWPSTSIEDYDAMIEIENALIANLSAESNVDGHDMGSGEANIFIRSNAPRRAFNEVRAILESRDAWSDARVAYRDVAGSDYTILWPEGLSEFRVS